ncbi:MAG: permease [Bacillota bacterium]
MTIEAIVIYVITGILLTVSVIKDPKKTKMGLLKGGKSFIKLMPVLVPLFLFIGILLAVVTPSFISSLLGDESGFVGILLGLGLGSITFMPPFVAYPLGVELLENGAALMQVSGFLVTLMSVGIVYFAAESTFFSKKAAVYRNSVSFIGAIIVVLVVWAVL